MAKNALSWLLLVAAVLLLLLPFLPPQAASWLLVVGYAALPIILANTLAAIMRKSPWRWAHLATPIPAFAYTIDGGDPVQSEDFIQDRPDVKAAIHEEADRLIEVSWTEESMQDKEEGFLAEIKIYARDRSGLLNELTRVFSEKDISILRISSATNRQGIATLVLGFEVKSREELHEITMRLQAVRDVQAIKRTNG